MQQVHQSLSEQMRMGDHEIERRKILLELDQSDFDRLESCLHWVEPIIDPMVAQFYTLQTEIPEIALIIGDKDTLANLHNSMCKYVKELFMGEYGRDYVNKRLRIGKIHQRIGVSPKLYLSAVSQLQRVIEDHIEENSDDAKQVIISLRKLFYFDNQLVFDTYISALQGVVESTNTQLEQYASNLEKNIAERTEALVQLSMRDPLTKLFNQRAFYQDLEKAVATSQRSQAHVTVLYIDLNHFKAVNDEFGHLAGDDVLIAFAETCDQVLRKSESAARYGGDEFCIIMQNTKIEHARNLCERLGAKFSELVKHDVTLSIGGASCYPGIERSIDELMHAADIQMYQAKELAHKSSTHQFSFEARLDDEDNVTKLA